MRIRNTGPNMAPLHLQKDENLLNLINKWILQEFSPLGIVEQCTGSTALGSLSAS